MSALAPTILKRILIVEDEYFIAEDLAHGLRRRGALVLGPVATIDDAMEIINEGGPLDGAVLDVNLGGRMSFAIADVLRKKACPSSS